ncbi:MAG: nucleotidyltransferase family protein [Syntrophales bacterium]
MSRKTKNKHAIIDYSLFSLINDQPAPCLRDILVSPELCRYLKENGVAGVLFYHLQKADLGQLAPPDVNIAIHNRFLSQVRRNMACAAAAKSVFNLLHATGIPFLVLKGIALAEHVYPHFAMRTTSDLDILIHKEDLLRADLAMGKAGYHAQDSTPEQALLNPPGYLASLEYHKPGTAFAYVHLHWHLINTSTPAIYFIKKVDMERIWEKSVIANVADAEVRLLCPEHLIIYLCEHALRVGHSFDRLILICDILYTIKTYNDHLAWDSIAAEAKSLGLLNFTYLGLKIVQFYGGEEFLNNAILKEFAPPSLSWTERLFISLQKNHYRIRGSSYLVYLALSKGPLNKAHLVMRTFFPPRPILAQRRRYKNCKQTHTLYFERIREIITYLTRIMKLIHRIIHP